MRLAVGVCIIASFAVGVGVAHWLTNPRPFRTVLAASVSAPTSTPGPAGTATTPAVTEVALTAVDDRWQVTYPGPDGRVGTGDDVDAGTPAEVALPAGADVRLKVSSRDYVYTVSVPRREATTPVAVPGLTVDVPLTTGPVGAGFDVVADHLCGPPGQSRPRATAVVRPPADWAAVSHAPGQVPQ